MRSFAAPSGLSPDVVISSRAQVTLTLSNMTRSLLVGFVTLIRAARRGSHRPASRFTAPAEAWRTENLTVTSSNSTCAALVRIGKARSRSR